MNREKNSENLCFFLIFRTLGDPPEPEELIKALLSLENSASSDANIRERIANLPPEGNIMTNRCILLFFSKCGFD